jgi:hypothetical protein
MKYYKYINVGKPENPGNYYFIKPFEILSSYNSFIDTWNVANKVIKEIDDVTEAGLMQSDSVKSRFGYISYSNWKSKEAFIKSNLKNTVLKYHNEQNGNGSKSAVHSLYKLISQMNHGEIKKTNLALEIIIIETNLSNDNEVMDFWNKLCVGKKAKLTSSYLFKSVYKKSKFRYIGFLYYINNDVKSIANNILHNKYGCKIYSSFYKKVKKY